MEQIGLLGLVVPDPKPAPEPEPEDTSPYLTGVEYLTQSIGRIPPDPGEGTITEENPVVEGAPMLIFASCFEGLVKRFPVDRDLAVAWLEAQRERWKVVWEGFPKVAEPLVFLYGQNPHLCLVQTHSSGDRDVCRPIKRQIAEAMLKANAYYHHSNFTSGKGERAAVWHLDVGERWRLDKKNKKS